MNYVGRLLTIECLSFCVSIPMFFNLLGLFVQVRFACFYMPIFTHTYCNWLSISLASNHLRIKEIEARAARIACFVHRRLLSVRFNFSSIVFIMTAPQSALRYSRFGFFVLQETGGYVDDLECALTFVQRLSMPIICYVTLHCVVNFHQTLAPSFRRS